MKPWLITLLILVLTTISAYTEDEVKPEPTVRQLQVKLAAAEDMFKIQKSDLERKVSGLVKEKEALSKQANADRMEIEKLKSENAKLKLEIESTKPKPVVVREQPKQVYNNLKFRNFATSATYKIPPEEVFPKLTTLFGNIKVMNTSEKDENKTYWVADKKEIVIGFGGKGGTISFNITDENQSDINGRLKSVIKNTTSGGAVGVTTDNILFQNEFKHMTRINSCVYKETETSEPITTYKLDIQHQYMHKVNFGQGIFLVLMLTPETGDPLYIVSIIEYSDIRSLISEISKYYDKPDTSKMATAEYDRLKDDSEERRKAKGLLTLDEARKAAGQEPLKKAEKEPKRDPWTKEIIKE